MNLEPGSTSFLRFRFLYKLDLSDVIQSIPVGKAMTRYK